MADVVDLAALRATAEQREMDARRVLTQAGLVCPCGQRIRGESVVYYTLVNDTPHGGSLSVLQATLCSKQCRLTRAAEDTAIARREGPSGRVTWLDRPGDPLHPVSEAEGPEVAA